MCLQVKLHVNVLMRHTNVIDSVKDTTGLSLCKHLKKIEVWG